MIYAQIKNGVVVNTIRLRDQTLEPIFQQGFDALVQIDNSPGSPGIGWAYDGSKFTAPPQAPDPGPDLNTKEGLKAYIDAKVADAVKPTDPNPVKP